MHVERVKYVIWSADMDRAVKFWCDTFDGRLLKQNSVIAEVEIAGAVIGIHSGGEGKRTWTGISLQVADVIVGARYDDPNGSNSGASFVVFGKTDGTVVELLLTRSV